MLLDKDITRQPPEARVIGYLPQNLALFPHLSVNENIRYGIKPRAISKHEANARFDEIITLLGLENLLERSVTTLSGGEKQKVALARALIVHPSLLLLDEPFASVDHGQRLELWFELKEIVRKLGLSAIHITHNLDEAHALADRLAVMIDGSIEQIGSTDEVFLRPKTEAVARYQGITNIFIGTITALASDRFTMKNDSLTINGPARRGLSIGQRVKLCVRPQDIKVIKQGYPVRAELADNLFVGKIISLVIYYDFCAIRVRSSEIFDLRFPAYIRERYGLALGDTVTIALWRQGITVLDDA
jgi:ABC-type Fe3+/spermidine/putrescine transport system ATPase subunit